MAFSSGTRCYSEGFAHFSICRELCFSIVIMRRQALLDVLIIQPTFLSLSLSLSLNEKLHGRQEEKIKARETERGRFV